MVKQGIPSALTLSVLLLCAAAAYASDTTPAPDAPRTAEGSPAVPAKESQEALGDAFIVQNAMRVYLSRPATITVHNAMGQLLFQMDSGRPMEILPLHGVNTGFLYLTLRAGALEVTKKLVYSGK